MTIEEAHEKAKQGGFTYRMSMQLWYYYYIDPEWWKALARGLGNRDIMRCENYNPKGNEPGERGCASDLCAYAGYKDPKQLFESFMVYYIWEGKTPQEYFKSLL